MRTTSVDRLDPVVDAETASASRTASRSRSWGRSPTTVDSRTEHSRAVVDGVDELVATDAAADEVDRHLEVDLEGLGPLPLLGQDADDRR